MPDGIEISKKKEVVEMDTVDKLRAQERFDYYSKDFMYFHVCMDCPVVRAMREMYKTTISVEEMLSEVCGLKERTFCMLRKIVEERKLIEELREKGRQELSESELPKPPKKYDCNRLGGDNMDELTRRLVIFCILMESRSGILGKSPAYILEKYNSVMNMDVPYPENVLDLPNREKYEKWLERWEVKKMETQEKKIEYWLNSMMVGHVSEKEADEIIENAKKEGSTVYDYRQNGYICIQRGVAKREEKRQK